MTIFLISAGILGLLIGSFLNVVVYRAPRHESLAFPASHCPECQHTLRYWENIPLFSWIYLRARCHSCKQPISWRYPALEITTSALTCFVAYHFGLHWLLIPVLLFSWALLALVVIDLETQLLPDSITKTFIVFGLLLNTTALFGWHIALTTWSSSLLGFCFGYGVLWLLSFVYLKWTGQHGMGGGDLKLLGMIGAVLGLKAVLMALFIAAISGGVAAVGYLIAGKGKDYAIPFGPYLALGGWLMLMWPQDIIGWYLNITVQH